MDLPQTLSIPVFYNCRRRLLVFTPATLAFGNVLPPQTVVRRKGDPIVR